MKNYLISVITVAICASLAGYMTVDNDKGGNGISKDLRMLSSICILLAVILPLSPLISNIGDISAKLESTLEILKFKTIEGADKEKYEKIFNSQLLDISVSEAENTVRDLIVQKFNISDEDCFIEITLNGNSDREQYFEKITVTLRGQAIWNDPYAIEEYIESTIGCECDVRSSN